MMKILSAILLTILTSSCATTKIQYVNVGTEIMIPEHKKLRPLTPNEISDLDPIVRSKVEYNKAILIGNIVKLETNIKAHNESIKE